MKDLTKDDLEKLDFDGYKIVDQILKNQKMCEYYQKFDTEHDMLKVLEDAKLCQQLVKILSNHCGETGKNEGVVETFKRIIGYAEKYISMRKDDSCNSLYEGYENYIQLKELLKKRIEELENKKYEAFEQIILDELQKILDGNNGS